MTLQLRQSSQIDLDRTYTAEEFEALPDDGNRYELLNGRLIKMPPAGDRHGTVIENLVYYLRQFDPSRLLGKTWATTGFKLDDNNTPEPDLMYVVANRRPPETEKALQIIPDLIVEVWSPSQLTKQGLNAEARDKIKKYHDADVKIIWSINPEKRTVAVYHHDQTDPVAFLTVNDELDGEQIIPGFKLKVSKLFE